MSEDSLNSVSRNGIFLPTVAASLAMLLSSLCTNALSIILVRASYELNVAPERLAIISSAQFGAFLLATVLGGIFIARIGHRNILVTSCLLTLLGSVLWIISQSLPVAYAAGACLGLSAGIAGSIGPALLAELYPQRRKLALNLSLSTFSLGAFGAPMLMGWLLPMGFSWRVLFIFIGALGLILFVICCMLPKASTKTDGSSTKAFQKPALIKALTGISFILTSASVFLYVMAENCLFLFLNPYLQQFHRAPERWAITAISLFWLAMTAGRVLCAVIPERVSYEKVIGSLFFACAVLTASQLVAPSWQASMLLFLLAGFACSGIFSLLIGMNASRHPEYGAPIITSTIAIGSIGGMSAPLFMNALFALLPGPWVYVCASGLFGAGTLLMAIAWRHGRVAVQKKEPVDSQPALI